MYEPKRAYREIWGGASFQDQQIKKNELDTWRARRKWEMHTKFYWRYLKRRFPFGGLDVDGRIISKLLLNMVYGFGVDSSGWGEDSLARSSDHGNEPRTNSWKSEWMLNFEWRDVVFRITKSKLHSWRFMSGNDCYHSVQYLLSFSLLSKS